MFIHQSANIADDRVAIRTTDVAFGLGHLPIEFYTVLHHNGLEWETEKKHLSVNGDVEWNGPIRL